MSCHTIRKNLYEPKMDVILTINFKITAEIEITKHMFCFLLCRRGRVSAFCKAWLCSFIHSLPWNMRLHCFFAVNSWVNAARLSCLRKFHGKGIKLKTFQKDYVICRCGVLARCSRVEPKVPGSSPSQLFFFLLSFFCPFFVLLFSINIYINNCFLIKCNKQHEKYRISREKIGHRILNIWMNNLNLYHFLQLTVGKPDLIPTWSFS